MIIENNSIVDIGGKTVFVTSLGTGLLEWISSIEFNDVVTFLMSIAGLVYICVKIQGQLLENRSKRNRLKDQET